MLPNSPTGVHARQRQHRRQNSTPSALEGVNISPLSNRRQAAAHRRGLSLDMRRQQTAPQTARQDFNQVRMATNNTGLANTSQHHLLPEAQQQRTQARPGPNQMQYASMVSNSNESFLISPHGTPQTQRFAPPSCFDTNAGRFSFPAHVDMMMRKNQENYYYNMAESASFDLFSNNSALSTPTFINFPDSPAGQVWPADDASSRRNSRRISDGIMDRVNKFEGMGIEEAQRPTTPPNQNGTNYYPPTPVETPHGRIFKQEARPGRFSDDYDESMEETIKPNRNSRSGLRTQSVFAHMRQQAEQNAGSLSPPGTNKISDAECLSSLQMQNSDYMNMNALRHEFVKIEDQNDAARLELDTTNSLSDLSHHTSPDTQNHGQFVGAAFEGKLDLQHVTRPDSAAQSRKSSPHRRTESVASMASAASIADINIDETRTDTGVTLEEISQYIHSPETTDGKWMCLFEDCGKKFGRKENIKSHVQTHLNDRQYQCPTCKKCFVRQHDLKRHAKIHTGIKPYPCECGNSFARHDALTRHRQRGMCIGAFDGAVRKSAKRGRPRKRPDLETRREKSARTRKKNMSISSMSSFSGYSDSSAINSPDNEYNMLDDMVDLDIVSARTHGMPSMSTAPMPTLIPRVMNQDMAQSPSVVSAHSYVSPEAIMDTAPSHAASPAKSGVSHYNTPPPPELSQSSSPPPCHFFDLAPNTSSGADLAVMPSTNGMMGSSAMSGTLPMGMGDQDDDLLLQFSQDDGGLVQLDRDSNMLMLSKFDDEFEAAVSMFTNNDDMFFSNS